MQGCQLSVNLWTVRKFEPVYGLSMCSSKAGLAQESLDNFGRAHAQQVNDIMAQFLDEGPHISRHASCPDPEIRPWPAPSIHGWSLDLAVGPAAYVHSEHSTGGLDCWRKTLELVLLDGLVKT